ncbi:MAG: M20 aminoacylase family protein [Rhodospirillales bacterium]
MPIIEDIARRREEMTAWRRHLHARPELAFEERLTAAFVADRLAEFGLDVHRGLAGTGVVGTLSSGDGPAIALRADMDALPIEEANDFAHRSAHPGRMHACGHDGHSAMLLGAARFLAETRRFRGTVHFVFQPAEENEGGARRMVEEGLFERFPVRAVYGMHNWPGRPAGSIAVRPGPMMAAFDTFEIAVAGHGAHAAMPHLGCDPVVAAAAIVGALQTVTSRAVDPLDSAVVSVTQFHAGDAWNVIPERALLRGTARALRPEVQQAIEAGVRRVATGVAAGFGADAAVHYERRYPPTVNDPAETERAAAAAVAVVGRENVDRDPMPSMGSEDFAFMLRERPGCYVWIGNGPGEGGCTLHNPRYDFNDAILPVGASYWATLVELVLA